MTPNQTHIVTLLIENNALMKTLLSLHVNALSEQTGESRADINKRVDEAIEENMKIGWKGSYDSLREGNPWNTQDSPDP